VRRRSTRRAAARATAAPRGAVRRAPRAVHVARTGTRAGGAQIDASQGAWPAEAPRWRRGVREPRARRRRGACEPWWRPRAAPSRGCCAALRVTRGPAAASALHRVGRLVRGTCSAAPQVQERPVRGTPRSPHSRHVRGAVLTRRLPVAQAGSAAAARRRAAHMSDAGGVLLLQPGAEADASAVPPPADGGAGGAGAADDALLGDVWAVCQARRRTRGAGTRLDVARLEASSPPPDAHRCARARQVPGCTNAERAPSVRRTRAPHAAKRVLTSRAAPPHSTRTAGAPATRTCARRW
jgi:hypothetical protein